jgi:hypothetical protein
MTARLSDDRLQDPLWDRSRLIRMYEPCILMHMRSTLNIDDEMLRRAAALTGEKEKTALVRMGLEALIARESARRLAKLGGTEPNLSPVRRRRRPAK